MRISTYPVGSGPNNVAVADVNHDGKPDLVTANATYAVSDNPISATAADLNKDGREKWIAANYGGNSLTVRLETPMPDLQFIRPTVSVSWPTHWAGYVLEQSTNLNPAGWFPVNNPTATNWLLFPATAGSRFYRLHHP